MAMMFGAEICTITNVQAMKVDNVEMKILRWLCGLTKKDKVRSERIEE